MVTPRQHLIQRGTPPLKFRFHPAIGQIANPARQATRLGLAPVPAPLQTVEFTLTLRNTGADAATEVVVNDRLPPELAIPTGLAAFPSVGTYDAATGVWTVGTLNPAASAKLVIPAVVVSPTAPPCGHKTTVHPVRAAGSSAEPTRNPGTSVRSSRMAWF